jgi:phosphoenolpyruvate carboxykinase (GTP)
MSRNIPLVFESYNWAHGVYSAATMGAESTAAAEENLPPVRRDPMAMRPFCAYNMGSYWSHWLDIASKVAEPPRIFRVNWFRRDSKGNFLWPGFGENMRILRWVVERTHGKTNRLECPVGYMPRYSDLHWEGMDYDQESFRELMSMDKKEWLKETRYHEELFDTFYDHLPGEFLLLRELLKSRLLRLDDKWKPPLEHC